MDRNDARTFFDARIDAAMMRGHYEYDQGHHTIGAFVAAVMEIDTDDDARLFYDGSLSYYAENGADNPAQVARANIGWCFGEGMAGERQRMWQRVCSAAHPIFGTAVPSFGEAFAAGQALAQDGEQ